jgi:hypothetical protein
MQAALGRSQNTRISTFNSAGCTGYFFGEGKADDSRV